VGITYTVVYHEQVVLHDIPLLNGAWRGKIKKAIESKLTHAPEVYGKPLRRSLHGYRKLRVGDWRVIFRIDEKKVKIFVIAHRSHVYKRVYDRI